MAGVPLAAVRELDVDELEAYSAAVQEQAQAAAWDNVTRILAAQTTILDEIRLQLAVGGVPTVQVKRQRKTPKPVQIDPPDRARDAGDDGAQVVTSFRDFARQLT